MSDTKKNVVVVTGATGAQGGSVVRALLKEGKYTVRAVTRDAKGAKAKALADKGVEVVQADLGKKDEVAAAFKGAWGVFGVTNFWDPSVLSSPGYNLETVQGNNIVDAAIEAKVQVLVYSALDDIKTATNGKFKVPHFSGKYQVYQRALKSGSIPNVTAFFAGFYATNLANFGAVRKGKDGVAEFGFGHLRADVAVPVFDVDDTGAFVAPVFANPSKYHGKIIRSGTYRTLPDMAKAFTCVTGKPARFVPTPRETYKSQTHPEVLEMIDHFNEVGYYLGADISSVREEFPTTATFEGWLWRSGYQGPQ